MNSSDCSVDLSSATTIAPEDVARAQLLAIFSHPSLLREQQRLEYPDQAASPQATASKIQVHTKDRRVDLPTVPCVAAAAAAAPPGAPPPARPVLQKAGSLTPRHAQQTGLTPTGMPVRMAPRANSDAHDNPRTASAATEASTQGAPVPVHNPAPPLAPAPAPEAPAAISAQFKMQFPTPQPLPAAAMAMDVGHAAHAAPVLATAAAPAAHPPSVQFQVQCPTPQPLAAAAMAMDVGHLAHAAPAAAPAPVVIRQEVAPVMVAAAHVAPAPEALAAAPAPPQGVAARHAQSAAVTLVSPSPPLRPAGGHVAGVTVTPCPQQCTALPPPPLRPVQPSKLCIAPAARSPSMWVPQQSRQQLRGGYRTTQQPIHAAPVCGAASMPVSMGRLPQAQSMGMHHADSFAHLRHGAPASLQHGATFAVVPRVQTFTAPAASHAHLAASPVMSSRCGVARCGHSVSFAHPIHAPSSGADENSCRLAAMRRAVAEAGM
mmetsp:Transcript_59682/g.142011  ORF Transcript_59682/g.142011 Transcript_59682/m.142011 type:complete len:489 (+) Transcript_59682:177-1643(+)